MVRQIHFLILSFFFAIVYNHFLKCPIPFHKVKVHVNRSKVELLEIHIFGLLFNCSRRLRSFIEIILQILKLLVTCQVFSLGWSTSSAPQSSRNRAFAWRRSSTSLRILASPKAFTFSSNTLLKNMYRMTSCVFSSRRLSFIASEDSES